MKTQYEAHGLILPMAWLNLLHYRTIRSDSTLWLWSIILLLYLYVESAWCGDMVCLMSQSLQDGNKFLQAPLLALTAFYWPSLFRQVLLIQFTTGPFLSKKQRKGVPGLSKGDVMIAIFSRVMPWKHNNQLLASSMRLHWSFVLEYMPHLSKILTTWADLSHWW